MNQETNYTKCTEMPEYFELKTTCLSCNERTKEVNQLVCEYCHENELKPEWLEGE